MATHVNVDNFVRAETSRMFADLQRDAGGVNVFSHSRTPTPVEHQTVVRMNRDTLYSFAVVDISGGATITIPEYGDRYVSVWSSTTTTTSTTSCTIREYTSSPSSGSALRT